MILTLDVGNTNMEFGIFEKGELIHNFRLITNRNVTSDEIGLLVTQFFSHQSLSREEVEEVVIASVVPQIVFSITNAMKKYLLKNPLFVGQELPVPMPVCSVNASEVGADRLADAFGAYCKYGGDLLVIDFGTATTLDIVDEKGAFHGGPTFPGIKTSMAALYHNAAMLPMIELEAPPSILAKDTVTSMQAGAIFGFVGAAEYMIDRMEKEFGKKLHVVATGGLASLIGTQTDRIDTLDKTLTLEGIYQIYQHARN